MKEKNYKTIMLIGMGCMIATTSFMMIETPLLALAYLLFGVMMMLTMAQYS